MGFDQLTSTFRQICGRLLRPLAVTSVVGMWIVLIMGATVTNTGSARGCEDTWPLCRGQFIPQFAFSTAIEYSHRSVVAILTVLIIALAICVWTQFRDPEIRLLSVIMVAFLFVQAGLGAWAVMSPLNAAVLATHFGVSLIAFSSVLLVGALVFEQESGETQLRMRPVPRWFTPYIWSLTIFSFLEVYLGAYVRHRNADDACDGWPLCNGKVIPSLHGLVVPAFGHRAAALVLVLGIIGAIGWSARFRASRPDIFRASIVAGVLVVLQALSGALVEATNLDLFSALLHAGLVALLFGSLTYLCLHVMRAPEKEHSPVRMSFVPEPV